MLTVSTVLLCTTLRKLLVAEGDAVEEGQTLFILEVMKMEVPYEAPHAGTVVALHIAEGDSVAEDDLALVIQA